MNRKSLIIGMSAWAFTVLSLNSIPAQAAGYGTPGSISVPLDYDRFLGNLRPPDARIERRGLGPHPEGVMPIRVGATFPPLGITPDLDSVRPPGYYARARRHRYYAR